MSEALVASEASDLFEPYSNRWKQDPYPAYRELRDTAPVHYAPQSRLWCVSRYEDVEYVLKHPELFDSKTAFGGPGQDMSKLGPVEKAMMAARMLWRLRVTPWTAANSRMLILDDGEVHHGLRTIVNRGFTPRRIRGWEARIEELVAQCMERCATQSSFDLIADLAMPLPVTVIAEMLGVEASDMHRFKVWSDEIVKLGTGSGMGEGRGGNAMGEMREYLIPLVRARRKTPTDDLISTIVNAEPGDQALTDHEVLMFFVLLLVAGNETTTNLLGNCVDGLLANPDALQAVIDEPGLIPNLVEETLRWDNPVQFINRMTTQEVELCGVRIPAKARMAVMLGAANRDERHFDDPERLDPRRKIPNHLGFGFGHHFCLGASLARLEATAALEKLVPELPRLERLKPEPEFLDSYLIRGRKRLELRRTS